MNPGTAACLEAIAIMNMEFSGQPYNAEREQTVLDGLSVGGGLGLEFSAELGELLSRALEAAGLTEGLKGGNSLLEFERLVELLAVKCEKALHDLKDKGCSA